MLSDRTAALLFALPAAAQIPPGPAEIARLSRPARRCRQGRCRRDRAADRGRREGRRAVDGHRRTPLHVAAHLGHQAAAQALLRGGANPNALDAQQYDIVTIVAVTNDVPMLKLALAGGCNPKNITSPYQGTALIAAAHLGHAEVVRVLIAAGAPLDHVNNLGWTALIESIVLGNGGRNHTDTLDALVKAGANVNLADRAGVTPLGLAKGRGYAEMVRILEAAGAK